MDLEVASGLEIYFFKARMDLEVASTGEIFFSKHKSIWKLLVGVGKYCHSVMPTDYNLPQ
jgi:hypothetical protein